MPKPTIPALIATPIAVLVLALAATSAPAAELAADRAAFNEMFEACTAQHGTIDSELGACIDQEIARLETALSARVAEISETLDDSGAALLVTAEAAWTDWRDASCAYDASLAPRDAEPRKLFCRLRMVNARMEQLDAGADWADFEGRN